jgi:hypothetical protein
MVVKYGSHHTLIPPKTSTVNTIYHYNNTV